MLRNRKEVNAGNLDGVHRDANTIKLKLGTFQTLTNWTAAGIGSIKKKRGVELLVGVPPTPPSGGVCPETMEESSIHEGYTQIATGTARLFRATDPDHNIVVYTGTTGAFPFLTTFDMDDMTVLADGFGNGLYMLGADWDRDNGDLYAVRATLVGANHRLGKYNPATAAIISEGPDYAVPGGSFLFDTKVGANYVYLVYSTHHIYVFDKATMTLQQDINLGALGLSHHCASVTIDGDDNAWGMTRGGGSYSGPNLLMKFTPSGTNTDYTVDSTMGAAATDPRTMYDSNENTIICSENNILAKFDIVTEAFIGSTFDTSLWTSINIEMNNYPVDGKFWHNISGTGIQFEEFDLESFTISQTLLWADVMGAHKEKFTVGFIFMPSLNCLHVVHGNRPATDGVDRICLPC